MIAVDFYDKRSARRERAQLSVDAGGWRLSVGERQLQVPLDRARLSERLGSVPRRLELGKDGYCEIADHDGLNRLLERLPDAESGVVRAQNSLLVGIAAAALLLLIGVAGWIWGLPLAAEAGSRWVAESVRVELSEQTLSVLEHRWLGESTLPAHDRERLQAALASMCGPAGESRKLRLSFRQGEAFGPNAFALPDGNVVMLDELYRLLDNDEQRLAVLAHEANLTSLNVGSNELGELSGRSLFEAVARNASLTSLNVSSNRLGERTPESVDDAGDLSGRCSGQDHPCERRERTE